VHVSRSRQPVHRGAARILSGHFTDLNVHAGTRSFRFDNCLPLGPAGKCRGCTQLRSWGGSLHTWRGPTSRTCRCPKKMQRAGSTSGAQDHLYRHLQ
ncbi:Hypothetical protein GSB_151543, partial [Giardia duodenalis]